MFPTQQDRLRNVYQKAGVNPLMSTFTEKIPKRAPVAGPMSTQPSLMPQRPTTSVGSMSVQTGTPTVPVAPERGVAEVKPVNWPAIRSALLKKHPNATAAQISDLDSKLKKAQVWESIKIGKPDKKYLEEVRKEYPDLYSRAIAEGVASGEEEMSETAQTALGVANELLNLKTSKISGIPGVSAFIPGTEAQLTKNKYNQLKSLLQLDNISLLKGTGAISEAEQEVLKKASTSLDRNLSDKDFKKVLTQLRDDLAGLNKVEDGKPATIGRFKVEVQ